MCALLGVDPDRPLSYDTEHELARISPIPEEEWAAVEWLHRQPDEQRRPRPRMTVGTLAANWQDEVAKARQFAELVGVSVTSKCREKKEGAAPPEWPAFLQSQGFPDCPWHEAERSLRAEFQTWLIARKHS